MEKCTRVAPLAPVAAAAVVISERRVSASSNGRRGLRFGAGEAGASRLSSYAWLSPRKTPIPAMKHRTKVMDHHHTRCWSLAGQTPIQFFGMGCPSASNSSSEDEPRRGASSGCSL